ncbi:hypothetical protein XELAEV_18017929mg [Xenopus laevis]|uniref:Paired box protein Pax-6 n=1 Tax=Xenopus laevis TaxID=8355 RepID=A0A974DCC2_XENLA|nr:hypothetical protein XELAEV_18017929mg [Xenopus laevis]
MKIAQLKWEYPSLFAWEIREKLLSEEICPEDKIPSVSSINRVLRSLPMDLHFPNTPEQSNPGTLDSSDLHIASSNLNIPPKLGKVDVSPPNCQQRNRTVFSTAQSEILEKEFMQVQYPDIARREKLAADTALSEITIRIWFSNRRAKWRREEKLKKDMKISGSACHIVSHSPFGHLTHGLSSFHSSVLNGCFTHQLIPTSQPHICMSDQIASHVSAAIPGRASTAGCSLASIDAPLTASSASSADFRLNVAVATLDGMSFPVPRSLQSVPHLAQHGITIPPIYTSVPLATVNDCGFKRHYNSCGSPIPFDNLHPVYHY